jgi:hypothetical protein
MKRKTMFLTGIIAVVVIVAALFFIYASNAYSGYEKAYDKLFKTGSMEMNVTADIKMDSKDIKAAGNMKTSNANGLVTFLYDMNANNQHIVMFSDGVKVYRELNGEKTVMSAGSKPSQGERGKFDISLLENEFASMIEAGKIKELQILEKTGENLVTKVNTEKTATGKRYEITVSDQIATKVFQTMVNEQVDKNAGPEVSKPKFTLNSFNYYVNENSDGYLSGINYLAELDMVLPASLTQEPSDRTVKLSIDLKISFVNPGKPVSFTLPDTSGYTPQQ